LTDRLVIKLKEKENVLHCVYLNDFNMAIAGFALHCSEAKSWYDGINKARQIYVKLKQDVESLRVLPKQQSLAHPYNIVDSISIKKSPLGSSIGKHLSFKLLSGDCVTHLNSFPTVSSLNNSHSGSVELNESKTVSVDFEKTNSISSDEGSYNLHVKNLAGCASTSRKLRQTSSNSLTVQSFNNHLNQSMPNLTSGPYHANSNNTLLVPGAGAQKSRSAHSSHSGNLLSPSQRGISYPPPSPTR
jgi:pleckstrin homology domain-containing family G member 5